MNYRRLLLILALGGAFIIPASAAAQSKSKERRQDRRELKQDRRERRDDRLDHARLKAALADFDRARRSRSKVGLDSVDARLRKMLREEAREGRKEIRRDRREKNRSQREVRKETRERRDHARQGKPGAVAKDTRDIRDDRRDARDDRRDLLEEKASHAKRQRIRSKLAPLYGKYDRKSLRAKRALIVDLVAMAKVEMRHNRRETREDRRELREDRRR